MRSIRIPPTLLLPCAAVLVGALVLAAGCGPSTGGAQYTGPQTTNTTAAADYHYRQVPSPGGSGDVDLPAPALTRLLGNTADTGGPPGPPSLDPPPADDERGTPLGVLLEGEGGALTSDSFTLASRDNVTSSAAGCFLSSPTATSGAAAVRVVICNASGELWDITGIGTIVDNTITVASFTYPGSTPLGGRGSTKGGLFYLDAASTYTITSPIVSGSLVATLPDGRPWGADVQVIFSVSAEDGTGVSGTLDVPLLRSVNVYAAGS